VEEHKAETENGTLIISVSNARLSVDDWQVELSEISATEDKSGQVDICKSATAAQTVLLK
jgi:hypothetical protein